MSSANHIGHKIQRVREFRNYKQETVASALGISQQALSKIEQSDTVDEILLERIAKVLNVTPEVIKAFDEEKMIMNIQNNYEGSNQGAQKVQSNDTYTNCTFNPIEKLVETVDDLKSVMNENKKLYEQLLKEKEERIKLLEKK